ncbi:MAG: DUF2267 domain-containing protein [Gammaproteobacteria bacterium]
MTTGLEIFDTTVQESNLWLKDLMGYLGVNDRRQAYSILRATLHAIRDRIGPRNAIHLGAQLPMLLRGLYYEGWIMDATPSKERHKQAFLDHVNHDAGNALGINTETAVRAVFEVIWDKIDPGEVAKIIELFPAEVRELWPRLARYD